MTPLYIHAQALLVVSRARRELNPVFSIQKVEPPAPVEVEPPITRPSIDTHDLMRDIRVKYKAKHLPKIDINDLSLDIVNPIMTGHFIKDIKSKTQEIVNLGERDLLEHIRELYISHKDLKDTHLGKVLNTGLFSWRFNRERVYHDLKYYYGKTNWDNGYFSVGHATAYALNRMWNRNTYYTDYDFKHFNHHYPGRIINTRFMRFLWNKTTAELLNNRTKQKTYMKNVLGLKHIKTFYTKSSATDESLYQYLTCGEHNWKIARVLEMNYGKDY